jgi:hypothetical protein
MEQKLAYEHCVAVLNAYCRAADNEDGETAFDLSSADNADEATRSVVTDAVRYLEWRGLLERGSKTPGWAMVAPHENQQGDFGGGEDLH